MSGGRPRLTIGTHGEIWTTPKGKKVTAGAWVRDHDGKMRQATATGSSKTVAVALLKRRILRRPQFGAGAVLDSTSPFGRLVELWQAELETRDVADGTRDRYGDALRLHVRPALEHFTLNEMTTSRVEWFLRRQYEMSYAQARTARTLLNQLFGFAMRHDAMVRNPVDGTSPLPRPAGVPQALTLEQVAAIRKAGREWRTEPGRSGPKPDGTVRDILEVLLATGMRPGEVLAIRPCDVTDGPKGMIIEVTGTVVQRKGKGAYRQDRPKTHASKRFVPVPEFGADVVRRRLAALDSQPERTIFANRRGGVLSPPNVRRTFREFLVLAGLADSGISLRWYRRTAATVVARAMGAHAAADFLGHSSTVVTEGHYIEPDRAVDRTPTAHLQRTLRAERPDPRLLSRAMSEEEAEILDEIDPATDNDGIEGNAA